MALSAVLGCWLTYCKPRPYCKPRLEEWEHFEQGRRFLADGVEDPCPLTQEVLTSGRPVHRFPTLRFLLGRR